MDFHGAGNAEIAVAALSEEVLDPFRNADDYAGEKKGITTRMVCSERKSENRVS